MPSRRYQADRQEDYRIVPLDGLQVLYHRPSGMTHFVAPPAPEILSALQDGPADAGELLTRMAERFELEDGAEALEARLVELEAAGLVRAL